VRAPIARALPCLTLAAALLVGAAPARAALDRCMTPFEDEVRLLVNQRRAQGAVCGGTVYAAAPALAGEQMLHNAAKRHSEDMALRDFLSHVNPDGATLVDRIEAEGYPWWALAENIAAGYTTPQGVVDGWMASAGHCVNIMNPLYTQIGVGYAYEPDDANAPPYVHYWTLNFGLPSGPTAGPPPTVCPPCDDGLDNDGDGWIDALTDPGCRDEAWSLEDPRCDDGLDNDGDGLVDWDGLGSGSPDLQCVDQPWRDHEHPFACGLGFEVAVLLPLLSALAFRRRLRFAERAQDGIDRPQRSMALPELRPGAWRDAWRGSAG
jgi:uncharacterized protein YkwD